MQLLIWSRIARDVLANISRSGFPNASCRLIAICVLFFFFLLLLTCLLSLNAYSLHLKLKKNRCLQNQISKCFKSTRRYLCERYSPELKHTVKRMQSTGFSSKYILGLISKQYHSKVSPLLVTSVKIPFTNPYFCK